MLNFRTLHSEWHTINQDPKQVRKLIEIYDLSDFAKVYGSCIQYTYYRNKCITLKDLLDLYVFLIYMKHMVYIRIGQIFLIIQGIIQAFMELFSAYRTTHGNIRLENILIIIQNNKGFTEGRAIVDFRVKFINFAAWLQTIPTADFPQIINICLHLMSLTEGVGPYKNHWYFFNQQRANNNLETLYTYKIPDIDQNQSLIDQSYAAQSDKCPSTDHYLITKHIQNPLMQQYQNYYSYANLYQHMAGILSFHLLSRDEQQQQDIISIQNDFWHKVKAMVEILESNNLFVYLIFFERYKFSPLVYNKMINTFSDFMMLDLTRLYDYLMEQQDVYLSQLSNHIVESYNQQIDHRVEPLFNKILQLILKDVMKQIKQQKIKNDMAAKQSEPLQTINIENIELLMKPKILELVAWIAKICEAANIKAFQELVNINNKLKDIFKQNLVLEFDEDFIKQVLTQYFCQNNYATYENFKSYSKLETPDFTKRLGCAILESNRQRFKDYFKDIFTVKTLTQQ